jgi:hypothetical protein
MRTSNIEHENVERPTSNAECRTNARFVCSGDCTSQTCSLYESIIPKLRRRSFGTIQRANLPIEIYRTERPIRSWLRQFFKITQN